MFLRGDGFSPLIRVPVLYRPILGSPEQFVIGVLCIGDSGRHLERVNALHRLAALYGRHSAGVILAIDVALDDLAEALEKDEFVPATYRSPISGLRLADEEKTEGRSLVESAQTWLVSMSSLQERKDPSPLLEGLRHVGMTGDEFR
jgi:hypothetical protein